MVNRAENESGHSARSAEMVEERFPIPDELP
jgi:hypothetical protein